MKQSTTAIVSEADWKRNGRYFSTVPEWYEFPVSDTQAYKMLGNGWTVDVIAHLIEATMEEG